MKMNNHTEEEKTMNKLEDLKILISSVKKNEDVFYNVCTLL